MERLFRARNRAVSRHGAMLNSAGIVTVVVHGFRIMAHHSEQKMGHIHSSELFCGVDV